MNCLGEAIKHMILKKDQPKWTNHKNTGFEINWSKQTTNGWTNWTQDFEKGRSKWTVYGWTDKKL
jgi:DUF2075 family protein